MLMSAFTVTNNREDAEDAVQNVFMRLTSVHLHTILQLKSEKHRRDYLLKAAKNAAIDHMRKSEKERSVFAQFSPPVFLPDRLLEETLCEKITVEELRLAMTKLDTGYVFPMMMFYELDIPVKEIAVFLNLSNAAVRKRLQRGRELLTSILKEVQENGSDR